MDDSNQDTVRSISQLIKDDDNEYEDVTDVHINVENELKKRGFPNFNRTDSQAPESLVAKSSKEEKPKLILTRKVIGEILLVCVLGACIITATAIIYHFYNDIQHKVEIGRRIYFDEVTRQIDVNNVHKETILTGLLGLDIPDYHLPYDCSDSEKKGVEMCLEWRKETSMNITYYEEEEKISCYDIEWKSLNLLVLPHDCYELTAGHWYGGGLRKNQAWPIEKMSFDKTVFVPGTLHGEDSFGPIVERYWLSSHGVAIFVEDDSPLHISMNQSAVSDHLCLYADYTDTIYPSVTGQLPKLNYTICVGETVKDVHTYVVNKIGKPSMEFPNIKYFQNPVWSTGNQFGEEYTQEKVEEYANSLTSNGDYLHSMLVLDHGWQKSNGDLMFDPGRFPDPETLISYLKSQGFDVCIAVHPFVNTDSDIFQAGVEQDMLVLDFGGVSPGLNTWYDGPPSGEWKQGVAASIDMHSSAKQWWKLQLQTFSNKYNNVLFRMNHGDLDHIPFQGKFHDAYENPSRYTTALSSLLSEFGNNGQIETAYKSQHLSVIVRLSGFNSTWDSMQSLLSSVLNTGIVGYPYIMPDVIGGNARFAGSASLPAKDLYIRWLQMSVFLPIMHFSVQPSHYDAETQAIAKNMITLRSVFVAPRVEKLVRIASQSMEPIVRPMWWTDPIDKTTYSIDDQFMLGEDVMVAPMMTQQSSRDVYFPQGTWTDENTQQTYTGPIWQANMQVPLDRILYFLAK